MLVSRENPASNFFCVLHCRSTQFAADVRESLDEARGLSGAESGHVLPDQHLGIAVRTRADPDRRDGQLASDLSRQFGRHHLHYDGKCSRFGDGDRVVDGLFGSVVTAALHPEAAKVLTLCGVKPMCAITGIPAAVRHAI